MAISGYSGSGKTTVALRLASALGSVPVVHLDDFYVSMKATSAIRPVSTSPPRIPRSALSELEARGRS